VIQGGRGNSLDHLLNALGKRVFLSPVLKERRKKNGRGGKEIYEGEVGQETSERGKAFIIWSGKFLLPIPKGGGDSKKK